MFKSAASRRWTASLAVPVLLLSIQGAHGQSSKSSVDTLPPPPAVMVSPAKLRPLGRQDEFIGRVQAIEKVDLRARVSGFLRERRFEAGAKVKKGDVLFVIEPEPFEAALAQRKAQVASAQATLENADIAYTRYETLERRDAVSTAQRDLKLAEQKRAAASVEEAKAAVRNAEITLSYTTIISPLTGRIGRSIVDPGNLVGPDSGVLTTVVRSDKMYVLFPITQAQLLEAQKDGSKPENLKVRVRLADGSLLKAVGVIDFLDVKVDPRTDSQLARAILDNSESLLTDGQTVRLVIDRKDPMVQLTIPEQSVASDQAGSYAFVVRSDGTVEQRRVKTGQSRDGLVVVTEGIKDGDLVVVEGLQKVRNGVKVTTKQIPDAAATVDGAKQ